MRISALLIVCGGLALSNAALAQDTTDGTGDAPVTTTFDALSPGSQKIAESLFGGQSISGDGTGETEAWSLDQIVGARQDGQGWGQIFKQMKAYGLVDARNLGQLVSGYSKASQSVPTGGSGSGIVVTTASGRTLTFGGSKQADSGKGSLTRTAGGSGRKFSGVTSARGSGGGIHSRGLSNGFKGGSAGLSSGSRGGGGFKGKSGKSK